MTINATTIATSGNFHYLCSLHSSISVVGAAICSVLRRRRRPQRLEALEGKRESEKEANILQLQRRPYKTDPQAERILS